MKRRSVKFSVWGSTVVDVDGVEDRAATRKCNFIHQVGTFVLTVVSASFWPWEKDLAGVGLVTALAIISFEIVNVVMFAALYAFFRLCRRNAAE